QLVQEALDRNGCAFLIHADPHGCGEAKANYTAAGWHCFPLSSVNGIGMSEPPRVDSRLTRAEPSSSPTAPTSQEIRKMLGVRTTRATAGVPGREAVGAAQSPGPVECEDGQLLADEWLATLSHELRNPLATILLALEAIADGHELDPAARRARDVAERY